MKDDDDEDDDEDNKMNMQCITEQLNILMINKSGHNSEKICM